MRIVMVCNENPLPGGLLFDRRIMQEGKTLHQAGHDVFLIARPGANMPSTFTTDGIQVILCEFVSESTQTQNLLIENLSDLLNAIEIAAVVIRAVVVFAMRPLTPRTVPPQIPLHLRPIASQCSSKQSILRNFLSKLKLAVLSSRIGPYVRRVKRLLKSISTPAELSTTKSALPQVTDLTIDDINLADQIGRLDPDYVVAHDLPVLRAAVAGAKACNAKIVYDSHELYPEHCSLTPHEQDYLRRLESYWLKDVDLAYTVNPLLAEAMSKIHNRQVHSITNAIDGPSRNNNQRSFNHLRRYLGLSGDKQILLFQGGFSPDRGLEDLITGMTYVRPSVHLAFMGYGDYRSKLEELIHELSLKSRVHFIPPRTQADLLEWTASADAGIIPYPAIDKNTRYASPNKLFEFIAAGLPFLSNDLPFVRMVVNEVQGAMVAELTSPTAFGDAINRLFSDSKQLERMRQNLYKHRAEYSWKKQGVKLLQLYGDIGIRHEPLRISA